jgi:hypothetical protein
MRVEDVFTQNRRLWVRLHEKGGKQHAMPCHHNLETYLHAYIEGAELANDPKALLFQTYSRTTGQLTGNPLPQAPTGSRLYICRFDSVLALTTGKPRAGSRRFGRRSRDKTRQRPGAVG